MTTSDFIALAALLAACLSALYTRRAWNEARKANSIAEHWQERPQRLAVFQSMVQFSRYCSKYVTLHHLKAVNGTRDLVQRLEIFKGEIEHYGPLGMPDIDLKAKELSNHAWQMQRLLDRVNDGQNIPLNQSYRSAQDNLDAVVDRFGAQDKELPILFNKYLLGN